VEKDGATSFSESEADDFANFFAPVSDVENGFLDGFLSFAF
jgi:hypothetical protein